METVMKCGDLDALKTLVERMKVRVRCGSVASRSAVPSDGNVGEPT